MNKSTTVVDAQPASHSAQMGNKNDIPIDELRAKNKLTFNPPKPLSVIRSRSLNRYNFAQSSYSPQQTMICYLNSGDNLVYPKTSFLHIPITIATNNLLNGSQDISVLLDEVSFYSSSGNLVQRERRKALELRNKKFFIHSIDELNTQYSTKGYSIIDYKASAYTDLTTKTAYNQASGTTVDYVIPLNELSCVFDVNHLISSFLLSNGRIEITLAPATHLKFATAVGTYTIGQAQLYLDCFQVTDEIFTVLQDESLNSGLTHTFVANELVTQAISNTNTQISIKKPVSMALSCIASMVDATHRNDGTVESWDLKGYDVVSSYRWRLGNMYFPNIPHNVAPCAYRDTLNFFKRQGIVDLSIYKGADGDNNTTSSGEGLIVVDLERSADILNYSGLPVSASRSIDLELVLKTAHANREVNVFLYYVKLATSYLYDNVLMKE